LAFFSPQQPSIWRPVFFSCRPISTPRPSWAGPHALPSSLSVSLPGRARSTSAPPSSSRRTQVGRCRCLSRSPAPDFRDLVQPSHASASIYAPSLPLLSFFHLRAAFVP
jgi:hypothetical protein